eukprot:CAMPEP_0185254608 /NCGR_PEP_ID=MMETSP1359-20130426/3492_1 /TAXON_ID=552665 /ORGANISM="Bigelowiella longifila, Strain CCMP242" /LENGTH=207 /DNA_ID=CAMNT_0027837827 /DNA_START=74 /DNA_END=697 /DNA_ORIENTATION=-
MNREEVLLPPIHLKRFQTGPALRCIFHTIVFNRSLHGKMLKPRDVDCDVFDVSYAMSDNKHVAQLITEGIRGFLKRMEEFKTDKGEACISFYTAKDWSFKSLFAQDDKFHWEKWIIPIKIEDPKCLKDSENDEKQTQRQNMLRECLFQIIAKLNEKTKHIPPLSSNEATKKLTDKLGCFPFEISYLKSDKSRWGQVKRTLQNPPSLM